MRTFIFGAGASVHAGYPLASKLWPALQEWAGQSIRPGDYCAGAVESVKDQFDVSLPLEQLLTELDKRIESPRDIYDKGALPVIRGQIQQLVCRYFDSIRSKQADLYNIFAKGILASGDVVVTFNYDVSLDRELQKSGKWSALDGYGFALDGSTAKRSPCPLLKLHGSTNWIAQLFGGLHGTTFAISLNQPSLGYRPVIPTPELEFLESDCTDPQFVMGTGYVSSLIMPAARKKFYMDTSFNPREWEDFWDFLWSQAKESIAVSDEVHVIGYSLPDYDGRARNLLLGAARPGCKVRLCCRADSERLVRTFREAGFADVGSFGDGSFESWLESEGAPEACPISA